MFVESFGGKCVTWWYKRSLMKHWVDSLLFRFVLHLYSVSRLSFRAAYISGSRSDAPYSIFLCGVAKEYSAPHAIRSVLQPCGAIPYSASGKRWIGIIG